MPIKTLSILPSIYIVYLSYQGRGEYIYLAREYLKIPMRLKWTTENRQRMKCMTVCIVV